MYRIGIDVGGTFTDLVAIDGGGQVTLGKTPSTPGDQSIGVMNGLTQVAESLNLQLAELLAGTERIVHGTTVATNALLERKGAKVGLLTTAGHRDVLEMREGLKPERYNLRLARPEALVPRRLCLGVEERIKADGQIDIPLDDASLAKAIRVLKREKVTSVAVCYLHAYRDDRHERLTRAALAKALPDVHVCLSSEVLPQIKEYERVSTTVVNAYVAPILAGYLSRLEQALKAAGYGGPVLIILSHGGIAPIAEAIRMAAGTVLSGPAGGVSGARHAAELVGIDDLIPFDMGGTSSDISLIVDGQATLASDRQIANSRIALPSLDIVTLGAGGGSIARVSAGGLLEVGPQSAGAIPGPACYGNGGIEPTVTDASMVLGYLDPDNFLGGRARLDLGAAETALQRLGAALGITGVRAAEGVHRVVNTQMAEGVRLATVRRGVDPRRFALLAFGGAAGLHGTEMARQLNLGRVVVPRIASVLSAWGMLATELRLEVTRTHIGDTSALDVAAINKLYEEMEAEGRQRLSSWFDGAISSVRSADMRYGEQIFEIDVPLEQIDFTAPDLLDQIKAAFERRHEALYTYSLADQDPVLINARVATVGALPALPEEPLAATGAPRPAIGQRRIYLGDWLDAPVYDFDTLTAGQTVPGPALVVSETTNVLLRDGDLATTTPHGWLDIKVPI
ncbi:MAG: hydantoinase/oxoprolinase family protein [Rhodospirillaceae bacterium]|jgi:N-methylhydantoinase A|nr:hydantoinase/oxoprolinase family protein [Rhodospirillaceae bacterium]MBT3492572.1 hydantoinase/oxoprolinase family protein [Rhodospirillaceae bacterium]MBT3782441.1 hydantoinase/oxoprolinase family protein [Rhodospirillaceae bacterium]MBT3978976.1 hydantoinase/oxoprolinase family protein [Rhodospirillaceae bacterium]MBT4167178.1 hydantoinase/oxoprolinase family protein [Rhodospirillaceae bacterium]